MLTASFPTLVVRETAHRGRGLFLADNSAEIRAGTPLLCEAALAACRLTGASSISPWLVAAQLVDALLSSRSSAVLAVLQTLEPRSVNSEEAPDAEAATAVATLRQRSFSVSDAELHRLLRVVAQNAMALDGSQALFPRASMCNHSCMPNATQQGLRRADGALCVVLRAVAPIKPGDEVVISYIDDLTASLPERAESLAHGLPYFAFAEWRGAERGALSPPEGLPRAPTVERRAKAFVDFFVRGEGAHPPLAPVWDSRGWVVV